MDNTPPADTALARRLAGGTVIPLMEDDDDDEAGSGVDADDAKKDANGL